MRIKAFATLMALPLLMATFAASAQDSAVGQWKTIDDETGKAMSITEVYMAKNGHLAAKVVETLDVPNATCSKCSGAQKGKPVAGMMVFWDVKPDKNGGTGGKGFKPSTGDNFKVKSVKLADGGKKLEVTGCKLVFCRTAHWQRVN
jgi:hypothetical protein